MAVVRVSWVRVDFVPADVGEDPLGIPWLLSNEPAHLRKRSRDALRIRLVERESHAEHDDALEALGLVRHKHGWILVLAAMEEVRGNRGDDSLIEQARASMPAPVDVHDAHRDGGGARPLHPAAGAVHFAAVGADPAQAAGPRVALRDGVRGDEPEDDEDLNVTGGQIPLPTCLAVCSWVCG